MIYINAVTTVRLTGSVTGATVTCRVLDEAAELANISLTGDGHGNYSGVIGTAATGALVPNREYGIEVTVVSGGSVIDYSKELHNAIVRGFSE